MGLQQSLTHISRLAHTLRYLRWEQILGRPWHRIYRPRVDQGATPAQRPLLDTWTAPAVRPPRMIALNTFRFLNVEGTAHAAADWNDPAKEKLWLYNLHYFEDLIAADAGEREAWHRGLLLRWCRENPPGTGAGWEPYPTSLRLVHWIQWLLQSNRSMPELTDSLATQARWLRRRLERHILGNHLLANAKALLFAGIFFEGDEAEEWRSTGCALLRRELHEQVLNDGGHFERSPMYHLTVTEDVLDVLNLFAAYRIEVPPEWRSVAVRMLGWATVMRHPDGEVPFFNDAAVGIAPSPESLLEYAARLDLQPVEQTSGAVHLLSDSGYARMQYAGCTVFFDVAPVGPDYLPGHAHADTLSLEASIGAQRVFVNCGTGTYAKGPERHLQRSTRTHNTIEIDEENSSEVWASFRVARRAEPRDVRILGPMALSAWHDGYCRLPGKPRHSRTVTLEPNVLKIEDAVEGELEHSVVGRFHLHPDFHAHLAQQDSSGARLTLASSRGDGPDFRLQITGPVSVTVARAAYHGEFGRTEPIDCIEFSYRGPLALRVCTELRW